MVYIVIILDLEVFHFFVFDRISHALCIGIHLDIVLLDCILMSIRVCHLRTYEDHPVMVAKGMFHVHCFHADLSIPINFAVSVVFAALGFWVFCEFFFYHNLDYVLVLSSLLWSLFHDNDSTHD